MSRLSCSFSGVEPQSPVRVILKDGPYPSYEVMRQKLVVSAGGHTVTCSESIRQARLVRAFPVLTDYRKTPCIATDLMSRPQFRRHQLIRGMHGLILDLSLPFWQVQPESVPHLRARRPPGRPVAVLPRLPPCCVPPPRTHVCGKAAGVRPGARRAEWRNELEWGKSAVSGCTARCPRACLGASGKVEELIEILVLGRGGAGRAICLYIVYM